MSAERGVVSRTKNVSFAVWTLHPASYGKKYIGIAAKTEAFFFLLYVTQDKEVCFFVKNKIKRLVFAALMTALCVIIGLFCKTYLSFGAIRITFENIPVLLAGVLLGPVYGTAVGAAADLVTAPATGSVNPFITLGAASVGLVAGLMSKYVIKKRGFLASLGIVLPSHVVGSMLIKSFGLWYFYGYAWQLVVMRIPLYFAISLAEAYIIYIIIKNKRINSAFDTKVAGK